MDVGLEQDVARRRASVGPAEGKRHPEWAPGPDERLPAAMGNRGFSQLLSRMRDGEGILPNGVVHPDVEAAIAATSRAGGKPLDRKVADHLEGSVGEPFADVRVHTDAQAAALARAVSARAFTVGRDIFFGDGQYDPASAEGRRLISHEAAHVVQQRGAPAGGPLQVSQPGDAMEREAEALAHDVAG